MRNHQNAARSAGGQVLYDSPEATTFRVSRSGMEAWFSISVGNRPSGVPIMMVVIEKEAMKQDVTLNAKAMAHDIGEAGRVAVYGILFVTGKSELKPESAPRLTEIAKLLTENPSLKVTSSGTPTWWPISERT